MGGFSWLARRPAAAGDPTHALFAAQSHSIVENLVALFEHSRAWNCSSDILGCRRIPSNRVARGAAPAIWPSGPQVFVKPVQRTLPAFLGGGFVISRGRIVMETVIGALIDVAAPRATSCERAATRSARVPQPLPRPRRPRRRQSRQGRCRYPHRSCVAAWVKPDLGEFLTGASGFFDRVGDADAAQFAACFGRVASRREAGPIGLHQGLLLVGE